MASHPPAGGRNAASLLPWLLVLAVLALAAGFFLAWPITGLADTDLWYHLNGGRFLARHGQVPASGFFSFLAAGRTWTNYYWLFQAMVYGLHQAVGPLGLIGLRAGLFLATMLAAAFLLLADEKRPGLRASHALLAAVVVLALLVRPLMGVRPHLVSYLFLALFLAVAERRPRWMLVLPLIAAAWANLHGVEYPVAFLVVVACLADALWSRWRTGVSSSSGRQLLALVLVPPAFLLSPFGLDLLAVPFQSAPLQHLYINELARPTLEGLTTVRLLPLDALPDSLANLLLALGGAALLAGLWRRRLAPRHAILAAGAALLLLRAERFRVEAVLLLLPLIREQALLPTAWWSAAPGRLGWLVLAGGPLVATALLLGSLLPARPRYPVAMTGLPAGVAAFLVQEGPGGRVLNDPGHGGFLQWQLGDRYRIAMDLEMMLFTDADAFAVAAAFQDEAAFARLAAAWQPDFVIPRLGNRRFAAFIGQHPRFQPIFFDETSVLYVDRDRHPDLAARHRLQASDPFALATGPLELPAAAAGRIALAAELDRLAAVYDGDPLVGELRARLAAAAGDERLARSLADSVRRMAPAASRSHALVADLAAARGDWPAARAAYQAAIRRAGPGGPAGGLSRRLAATAEAMGDLPAAYQAMAAGVSLIDPDSSSLDLYRLGHLALSTGCRQAAANALGLALLKVPAGDEQTRTLVEADLARLASGAP
ncbi:MAG: hypothetical protein AB1634_19035 [Thermodesulfobacteriota bacterium]